MPMCGDGKSVSIVSVLYLFRFIHCLFTVYNVM
jgi:hypothetical protein